MCEVVNFIARLVALFHFPHLKMKANKIIPPLSGLLDLLSRQRPIKKPITTGLLPFTPVLKKQTFKRPGRGLLEMMPIGNDAR